ncbi:aldo-keto reductase family 1 member A1-A isoform X1 [Osmia bicornis bicornis]|uniref:aldo-keto reductase family 1 member A1-A isoform X1 n=2 Tax=Osmia bicornis bicornis TaxID=1437191 RepID=UPI0010FA6198|nr:aldo-keto reductase family 1 member A1-A isoform X1 [Osmia bicornis bicornis]XP_029051865.1 aldo-keto reductase family 1 member A1-A isoform X1 [Osmia bicornis bicornis]
MDKNNAILLSNEQYMPILGFGTWRASEEELMTALDIALEAGYRHIDTAPVYFNEKAIGKVLKKWFDSGKLKRSDIFIATKLPPTGNRPEYVEKWIKKSLEDLQLDYLDLYLIHTPFAFKEVGDDLHPCDKDGQIMFDPITDHVKVWAEMEKQVECGRAKAIGLSNFNIKQIERVLKSAKINISMLQIELHVYFQQQELVNYCKSKKIAITAYSPLGSRSFVKATNKTEEIPDMLQSDVVLEIAKHYNKSPAQILLRYIIQNGIAVIPKSTNPQRIKENTQLFDWKLESQDMKKLKNLDRGESGRICDFGFFKGIRRHPEFPF